VAFIRRNRHKPFFLYMPHTMVHVPLFRDTPFVGRSARGLYGDTVEEIDWSVGRILETLRELGLDRDTLVVFSSDNGPWLTFDEQGGSAGLLRMGKGSTWEGGVRAPAIFWMPGTVKEAVTQELGSTLDLLPTFAAMAGLPAASDRVLDGYDLTSVLRGTGTVAASRALLLP
jgi:arylsulfatase A